MFQISEESVPTVRFVGERSEFTHVTSTNTAVLFFHAGQQEMGGKLGFKATYRAVQGKKIQDSKCTTFLDR